MKSLRYIFSRQPRTLDDCLDFARSERPRQVRLELQIEDVGAEFRALVQLIGRYRWDWGNRSICCDEVYGGLSLPATACSQETVFLEANHRLENRLVAIQQAGIEVAGKKKRFESAEIH